MRDRSPTGTDVPAEQSAPSPSGLPQPPADALADEIVPDQSGDRAGSFRRRGGAALAWIAGAAVVFFLFLKVSLTKGVDSDGANNALQAWDLLHGHILLHGWVIGDATYYTFELPVIAIVEFFYGVHDITMTIAEAVIYLIVSAWAVAIAVTGSRGWSRAVRAAIVVAVLAAPAVLMSDVWIPLGIPDHTGTTVFLLASCLLVDRAPARWFTAPLVCVILAAGQIGDVTVRYVAIPAIVGMCAYRILATRKVLGCDGVNLLGAALSLPLALEARKLMLQYGAYLMVSPKTKLSPFSVWGNNAALTWGSIREVFGAQPGPGAGPAGPPVVFGYACLAIAVIGIVSVLCRWRTARRAEQALVFAIAANIAVYIVSTLPAPNTPHDIVAILPASAVLGATALVPQRITSRVMGAVATAFACAAAVLPLSHAASAPEQTASLDELGSWLQAHGLTYGLGGYWDSSAVTVETSEKVQIRAIHMVPAYTNAAGVIVPPGLAFYAWETNSLWYDPTKYYANFAVFNLVDEDLIGSSAATDFGKPASVHYLGGWEILVYNKNLLQDVHPSPLPSTS